MDWLLVWCYVGGMVSGIGLAALLDNFLERRIDAFAERGGHERK